ncbi:uncharacterized protein BDV14DRAFT_175140 [Aspergillus stella-maris]|uniref:uncharacterized protein n=1 Tax=Aspergillus stella-maris TaxID=1810926 RepID=UPI003CCD4CB1
MPDLSSEAFGHAYATPDAAYERVRLFLGQTVNDDGEMEWTLLDRRYRLNATQLQSGLVLALDSRELVRDKSNWDGKVLVQLDVYDGKDSGSDSVALKLAPVVTHHHLQEVETIVSVAADSDAQRRFLSGLNESRQEAGIQEPLLLLNQTDDIWAQDFFEPAYSSMPGPDGPIAIRIMLRSAQSTRTAGRQVFDTLRGKGIGGFQPAPGFGHEEINSFGNLETIPPYVSKSGVAYNSGRIITGKHFGQLPAESMLNFLNSQEVQAPLVLETGWLLIGHVDEFVQFLPFGNDLGWTIAIADINVALDLLSHANEAGHGDAHAISFNRTSGSGDYGSADPEDLALTIDDLLGNQTFREINEYAQRHIDANLEVLLSEIDLPREQVIRVPTLFRTPIWDLNDLSKRGGLPPHSTPLMPGEYQLWPFGPLQLMALS